MLPPRAPRSRGATGPIAFRPLNVETGIGGPLMRAEPDGSQVRRLNDLPGFFADWRADGERIAFDFFEPGGDEQIATIEPDGRDLRVITSGAGIHEVPSCRRAPPHRLLARSPIRTRPASTPASGRCEGTAGARDHCA